MEDTELEEVEMEDALDDPELEIDLDDDDNDDGSEHPVLDSADEVIADNLLGLDPGDDEIEFIRAAKERARSVSSDIEAYMGRSLFNHRTLSKEEEEVASNLVKLDDPRGIEILVRYNQRLVRKVAQKYYKSGMPIEDLVMEGNVGLMRAAQLYDADTGFRFSTYAMNWIKQSIQRAISNQNSIVRLPVHVHNLRNKVIGAAMRLRDEGVIPTAEKVVEALKDAEIPSLSVENVNRIMNGFTNLSSFALDQQRSDSEGLGGGSMVDSVSSHQDDLDESELSMQYAIEDLKVEIVRALKQKEFDIICMRFGLFGREPATLEHIGAMLSLTRERIRQIEVQAVRKLKVRFRALGMDESNFLDYFTQNKSSDHRMTL